MGIKRPLSPKYGGRQKEEKKERKKTAFSSCRATFQRHLRCVLQLKITFDAKVRNEHFLFRILHRMRILSFFSIIKGSSSLLCVRFLVSFLLFASGKLDSSPKARPLIKYCAMQNSGVQPCIKGGASARDGAVSFSLSSRTAVQQPSSSSRISFSTSKRLSIIDFRSKTW